MSLKNIFYLLLIAKKNLLEHNQIQYLLKGKRFVKLNQSTLKENQTFFTSLIIIFSIHIY